MLKNLQEWAIKNKPSIEMIWNKAFWEQIIFIRDTISQLLMQSERADADTVYKRYEDLPKVISTHTSKSITCPVYQISWHGFVFVMRDNYYNWKVSVTAPYSLKDIDFEDIFDVNEKISDCYCEGMAGNVYGSFLNNPQQFTIELEDNKEMYFFFRKIWYDFRKKEKVSESIPVILKSILNKIPENLKYYCDDTLKDSFEKTIIEEEGSASKIQSWNRLNTILSLSFRYNDKVDKKVKKDIYSGIFGMIPEWLEEKNESN